MKLSLDMELSRKNAVLLLSLTAILWSLGGMLIKMVAWNPMAIAWARSAVSSLLFYYILKKQKHSLKLDVLKIAAALAYAGTVVPYVAATKMTTAANAILLQYAAPVYVAFLARWLLDERTETADWITIAVVLSGMLLFFVEDLSPGNMAGNLLAVLSGVAFAFLVVLLRKQKDGSPLESVFWGNLLTFLMGLPFMGGPLPPVKSWLIIVVLGLFQLGLAYVFYSIAIRHVTALDASLIPVLEPVLNPVWVGLTIGEVPSVYAIAGGIIVLTAVTVRCLLPVWQEKRSRATVF